MSGESPRSSNEDSPNEEERKDIAGNDEEPTKDLNAAVSRIHMKP